MSRGQWPGGRVLEASPFHGEGYRKAWAKLRVAGIRTAPERVRRLMREHDLQAPHRVGQAHGPKAHDGTITTAIPDVMWGTDMTATVTVGEGTAYVFVAVDREAPRRHTMPSAPAAGKCGIGAGRTSVSQSWKVTGHFFRLHLRLWCPGSGHNQRIL